MLAKVYELDDPDLPEEAHKLRRAFHIYPRRRSTYDKARAEADKHQRKLRKQEALKRQSRLFDRRNHGKRR